MKRELVLSPDAVRQFRSLRAYEQVAIIGKKEGNALVVEGRRFLL